MKEDSSPKKSQPPGKPPKPAPKAIGPVQDLEKHVRSDWWRYIFNRLYLKTDADVVDDQNITRHEIDLLLEILKITPDDKILDLACGQGRHSLEFARRGFKNVEGLDRSHYLIQRAKTTAKKEGLSVRFREGDARKIPFQIDHFDVVTILGNSFGYFENPHDDERVLKEVKRVLKPRSRLLVDVTDGGYMAKNFQPRSWEWIDKKYFVCRERSLSDSGSRLISREVITHVEKGVIADQFYAERLYTRESLQRLLENCGFSDIQFHGEISPDSQRKQDLGMMEVRLIATAAARKDWTQIRRKPKKELKNIIVVMGDPAKPDKLKPATIFDEDDYYTIDRLKEALRECKDYNFTYLNNHNTLVQDLLRLKPKTDFVFNLCDEGFLNDAKKELHVPAVLEMMNFNFTGSTPQCLAYCYDKSLVRGIAKEMDIPVPEAFFIKPEDSTFDLPLSFPVICKPNFGDSSFGITLKSVAYSIQELMDAINSIRTQFGYDFPILVEEFLTGKDISLGILGNPPESYTVLPMTEEDYSDLPEGLPQICGYEAKWLQYSAYWGKVKSVRADLPPETYKFIIECSLKLLERLQCRDYTRLDWRLDANGNPKLLEVNPNPGWCWDGHLAKMAELEGFSYPQLLEAILKAAETRINPPAAIGKSEETNGLEIPHSEVVS